MDEAPQSYHYQTLIVMNQFMTEIEMGFQWKLKVQYNIPKFWAEEVTALHELV